MTDPKGSIWRKWDLHIHTPSSIIQHYGEANDETWDKFLKDIEALPPEFKVIGINDYNFIDGYKRVRAAKDSGRLKNIDLILPVVELRIDKFGGTEGSLRRVNLHVIFSDELEPDIIQAQFLSALEAEYRLTPIYDSKGIHWSGAVTRESLRDLGQRIIDSVPANERQHFDAPLKEGFNNLNLSFDQVLRKLKGNTYLNGKYLIAVGKTEWASIKWNDATVADKKTIINNAHFVFISSETPADFKVARKSLQDGGVNDRLLDCSDAHRFSDEKDKDRIGKCFTWIKGDTCFETLKQAFFEPECRICVEDRPPLDPIYRINKIAVDFPEETKIEGEDFCFRGKSSVYFSPNLTCFTGGRGTGKSMILNLLHEKLYPGANSFFMQHPLQGVKLPDFVQVEGATNVEFLSQNEIEEFATNEDRFTSAIFGRLVRLDKEGRLSGISRGLVEHLKAIDDQIARLELRISLTNEIEEKKKELETYRGIIGFLKDAEYLKLSESIRVKTDRLQELKSSSRQLAALITGLQKILGDHAPSFQEPKNSYQELIKQTMDAVKSIVGQYMAGNSFADARAEEDRLSEELRALQGQLEVFLHSKGLSAESLLDISRANQMFASTEAETKTLEVQMQKLNLDIASFSPDFSLRTKYEAEFSSQLRPVVERLANLSSEVKPIGLEYNFDKEGAMRALLQDFIKRLPADDKGGRLREDYVRDILFEFDPEIPVDREAFVKRIAESRANAKTATAIRAFFENEDEYEIYRMLAARAFSDSETFKTIQVSYDNRPLRSSSFGQRCAAAIVILLLLGNTPLIIDEPEAHLDSSLIAKYLVDLIKQQKQIRQIVFATHNANIVVNGDAELVNALDMSPEKKTVVTPTTIENLRHREKIVALEGGEEAFKRREEKYEFKTA